MKFIDESITGVFLLFTQQYLSLWATRLSHEMPEVNISENIEHRNIDHDNEWTLIKTFTGIRLVLN